MAPGLAAYAPRCGRGYGPWPRARARGSAALALAGRRPSTRRRHGGQLGPPYGRLALPDGDGAWGGSGGSCRQSAQAVGPRPARSTPGWHRALGSWRGRPRPPASGGGRSGAFGRCQEGVRRGGGRRGHGLCWRRRAAGREACAGPCTGRRALAPAGRARRRSVRGLEAGPTAAPHARGQGAPGPVPRGARPRVPGPAEALPRRPGASPAPRRPLEVQLPQGVVPGEDVGGRRRQEGGAVPEEGPPGPPVRLGTT
jgi:hypothetical protein